MSEREAMSRKVAAYHNEQARGASFEWHARCATHVENQEQILKALADYIERHAGHEDHCRGWRSPVKDKAAPAWKRKGEWMDLSACTCGPGALLRLAGRLP